MWSPQLDSIEGDAGVTLAQGFWSEAVLSFMLNVVILWSIGEPFDACSRSDHFLMGSTSQADYPWVFFCLTLGLPHSLL